MGYPKREDGQVVMPSNYERIAWAVAGSRAIISNPQGVGVLTYPLAKYPKLTPKIAVGSNNSGIATHSAWVDLGLAFGLPILALIFSALLLIFTQAVHYAYPAQMTVLGFIVLLTSLYTVGEVGTQHGIEILYYLIPLFNALLLINSDNRAE
jgi:hypothetical protein